MSDEKRSARVLDELVEEAREHLDVECIDWARVEARVMARVEEDKPASLHAVGSPVRDSVRHSSDGRSPPVMRSRERVVRAAALVLAAAAAVAIFVHKDRVVALHDQRPATDSAPASSLRSTEPSESSVRSEVRVGAVVARPGYVLHAADAIEVDGARAVFERAQKVTWLVEQDGRDGPARAHVKSAAEPLVIGLDHGVIEAQVTPVPVGEAFAVDVATDRGVVRVAVHGTHLRVARAGNRVVVDLTEGVVSIGVPPRTGVTYGTLVTAPAHVELDATDLGTLRVDHTPASVRTAIPLGTHELAALSTGNVRPEVAEPLSLGHAAPLVQPLSPATSAMQAAAKGAVARPVDTDRATSLDSRASRLEPRKVALPPHQTIVTAIRDCAAARSRSGDVRVTVTSNLRLRVSAAGVVETAQFSPPLLPEIQTCAAQTIYRTQLEETGLVVIPLEFSY